MRNVVFRQLVTSQVRWVASGVLVVLLAVAAGPTVAAAQTISASGTFTQNSFVPSSFRTVGGVTMFDFVEHDSLKGTLVGTTVINGTCVVQTSGDSVCQAVETFTGSVGDASGTLTFRDVVFVSAAGAASGTFTIVSGTGGLATLHGHGSFQGVGGTGTYSGILATAP